MVSRATPEEKEEAASVLGRPSSRARDVLWFVVFGILAAVIIGGGLLGVRADGSDETALYGFVGIALGAVVGLLAPSPGGRSGG